MDILDLTTHYTTLCSNVYQTNFAALKLNFGYDFNSNNILRESKILKYSIEANFNYRIQEQILSPSFSYKDRSNHYVLSLHKVLEKFDKLQQVKVTSFSLDNYFQNENAYRQLQDDIHKSLVEEMKEYIDENDNNKLKKLTKNKISEILSGKEILVLDIFPFLSMYIFLCPLTIISVTEESSIKYSNTPSPATSLQSSL